MPDCIVPGCVREAPNNLSVRLRRPDTSAIWAPNTEAYVCDVHAYSGAKLTVLYEPSELQEVEVGVHGVSAADVRSTPIRHAERAESFAEDLVERAADHVEH